MNKQEWKKEYRKWRSAISSINRSHLKGLSESEMHDVWDIFWKGIWLKMPESIRIADDGKTRVSFSFFRPPISSVNIKCNIRCLPNSYPRTCRNPGL